MAFFLDLINNLAQLITYFIITISRLIVYPFPISFKINIKYFSSTINMEFTIIRKCQSTKISFFKRMSSHT